MFTDRVTGTHANATKNIIHRGNKAKNVEETSLGLVFVNLLKLIKSELD